MDACLSTWDAPQWNSIHHQGLETGHGSGSSFILMDPIQDLQRGPSGSSMAVSGAGIPWTEGAPLLMMNNQQQHQNQQPHHPLAMLLSPLEAGLMGQFDGPKGATSGSIDHLLSSGTNSNTDTSNSVEDDGISRIFSDCQNLLSFDNPRESNDGNRRKRSNIHIMDDDHDYMAPTEPGGGFRLIRETNPPPKTGATKKIRLSTSSNISFQQVGGPGSSGSSIEEPDAEAIQQMKEMIYRAAAFRPVSFGEEVVEKPKRKNVKISSDPQTVAARQRRERISERLRVLQKLVPGGNKMDTASMLDEAANYLKFLRNQVKTLEAFGNNNKLEHLPHYSPNNVTTNHNHCPPNIHHLQFSSHPLIPMQSAIPFSLQNPNQVHVPKS